MMVLTSLFRLLSREGWSEVKFKKYENEKEIENHPFYMVAQLRLHH